MAKGWIEMAGERRGGVGNKGSPIRLLNTQRVGSGFTISDQLDKKSGFRPGGGLRGQRLQGQRLSGTPHNNLTGKSKPQIASRRHYLPPK